MSLVHALLPRTEFIHRNMIRHEAVSPAEVLLGRWWESHLRATSVDPSRSHLYVLLLLLLLLCCSSSVVCC